MLTVTETNCMQLLELHETISVPRLHDVSASGGGARGLLPAVVHADLSSGRRAPAFGMHLAD
jgi:hypothetical protein